ncbi:phage integrase N-terminal SAM-like domain-containing protein [Nitrosomonas sp. Nm166]|uniref:phage integrase N-terminal SAM-like domain-containing protein n=1 Tax=Nitrosomonas sp. Nm166 TaxID=1881054 RepID=UPI0035239D72
MISNTKILIISPCVLISLVELAVIISNVFRSTNRMNKPIENKPRLLDQVQDKLRLKHYNYRTEQLHIDWIKRFIL